MPLLHLALQFTLLLLVSLLLLFNRTLFKIIWQRSLKIKKKAKTKQNKNNLARIE